MRYLPHDASDRRAMLAAVGVSDIDALFESVPPKSGPESSLAQAHANTNGVTRDKLRRVMAESPIGPERLHTGGLTDLLMIPVRHLIAALKSVSQIDSMQQRMAVSSWGVAGSSSRLRLSQTSLIRTGGTA